MAKHWFKNAIIYSLHVESFLDSDGDGIGDFRGLTRSLDYLSGLGANCVWLLPFYPSPFRDHGYDIVNYLDVDKRYGTIAHFVDFVQQAEERGIRILVDLVLNHTSDEHPWFQEARKDKNSKYHNYYIWTDKLPKNNSTKTAFGSDEDGLWEWDDKVKRYYYHSFYPHQPDLNLTNPDVQEEIKYILQFWLKLGIAGFRMDAVHQMLKPKGPVKFKGDPHDFIRDLREFVEEHRADAILLAEVDIEPKDYKTYMEDGEQLQMLFNFYLNSHLYLAMARNQAEPIIKALNAVPRPTLKEQMGTFLRNHDELNLERLTKKEQQEVFKAFGQDENMQVYGRGIRRRLAPMLNNDRRRIELMYSLLFSLPGTPIIRYGQEIGMGDDLSLGERNSVRTAMQWSNEPHGGFSKSEAKKLPVPVINKGDYGYEFVNVHSQMRDPDSFINWMERVITVRKECFEFGFGDYEIIKTGNEGVLAHYCKWKEGISLAIHNLSEEECTISLKLNDPMFQHLIEHFSDRKYEPMEEKGKNIKLAPFGYRWFRKSTLFL